MGQSFDVPEPLPLDEQRGQTFPKLVELMQRLLAPDGCPWDREQDYASLRKYVLEEACEVIDAIDNDDRKHLEEELGDLALQVVFLGELGRAEGAFGPDDVVRGIVDKLVRRHPHVFGDVDVSGSEEVLRNWETIKANEKRERPLLDGVPRSLPALYRAQRMSDKVSRVGFDWPDGRGSRAKVAEELGELDEAIATGDTARIEHELGDMLFALVNLARHHGVDAEIALRKTGDRFSTRFAHVERRVKEKYGGWPTSERSERASEASRGAGGTEGPTGADDGRPARGLPLDELDGYWDEAKELES